MAADASKLTLRARIRALVSLPGRVIYLEEKSVNLNDRLEPIEGRVLSYLDKMREELAEMRVLVLSQIEQDTETYALLGSILQDLKDRVENLERLGETVGNEITKTSPSKAQQQD
ncbi:MAG: hypothetical protein M1374_08145 [Firmicutes bacterium]|nr:hypothetical protein [Bacillota bacterium]